MIQRLNGSVNFLVMLNTTSVKLFQSYFLKIWFVSVRSTSLDLRLYGVSIHERNVLPVVWYLWKRRSWRLNSCNLNACHILWFKVVHMCHYRGAYQVLTQIFYIWYWLLSQVYFDKWNVRPNYNIGKMYRTSFIYLKLKLIYFTRDLFFVCL